MKKTTSLFAIFFMALAALAQDCNIGNSNSADPNFVSGEVLPNFLLGVNFTLSQVGVLHSLNMIGNNSGADFQMAIYDDNEGIPNNLIAQTAVSTVGTGIISLAVTPVELPPGDYWIMAVYNTNGSGPNHSNVKYNDNSSVVYYTELTFGNAIPQNASTFKTYNGIDLLYFAEISCGTLSVNDFEVNKLSISPNPASDYIAIGNLKGNMLIEVYDISGKKLLEKEVNNTNNTIDISPLAAGVYLLNYGARNTTKFLKH